MERPTSSLLISESAGARSGTTEAGGAMAVWPAAVAAGMARQRVSSAEAHRSWDRWGRGRTIASIGAECRVSNPARQEIGKLAAETDIQRPRSTTEVDAGTLTGMMSNRRRSTKPASLGTSAVSPLERQRAQSPMSGHWARLPLTLLPFRRLVPVV